MGNAACCATDVKAGQNDLKDTVAVSASENGKPARSEDKEEVVGGNTDPTEFKVRLVKAAGANRLGVDVELVDGVYLLICKVNDEGMMMDWNKANPEKEVKKDDRIVQVNGSRGNAQTLAEICKRDDTLEMIVQRLARGA